MSNFQCDVADIPGGESSKGARETAETRCDWNSIWSPNFNTGQPDEVGKLRVIF